MLSHCNLGTSGMWEHDSVYFGHWAIHLLNALSLLSLCVNWWICGLKGSSSEPHPGVNYTANSEYTGIFLYFVLVCFLLAALCFQMVFIRKHFEMSVYYMKIQPILNAFFFASAISTNYFLLSSYFSRKGQIPFGVFWWQMTKPSFNDTPWEMVCSEWQLWGTETLRQNSESSAAALP